MIGKEQAQTKLVAKQLFCCLVMLLISKSASAEPIKQKPQGGKLQIAQYQNMPQEARSPWPIILKNGTQLLDAGRLQDALNVFQHYCRSRPQDAKGYFWVGVVYDEMGNYPDAIQAYRDATARAEQNAMDSAEIRTNLGNSLMKQNELTLAIESYKRAVEINPLYGLARMNLGRAYISAAEYEKALAAFDKCEELHFSNRQLPYYRAKALLAMGRKEEAAAIISRLLLDQPEGEARKAMQEEFKSCLAPKP
ncbi:MAG: tetratricopeptide repeat protein [Candidatus Obscuribacterales bacterium]|nr:tetratricopeptide repeat protein [Candidatus Obscuribacterales bacterium]